MFNKVNLSIWLERISGVALGALMLASMNALVAGGPLSEAPQVSSAPESVQLGVNAR